jgi:hypothetical protein
MPEKKCNNKDMEGIEKWRRKSEDENTKDIIPRRILTAFSTE